VDESKTGGIRGVYLTLANAAFIIPPAIAGFILTNGDFWKVYLVSSLFLIPLFFICLKSFKKMKDAEIAHVKILEIFKNFRQNKNIYSIFMAQFILQFFFVYMVVYVPIYLYEYVGFSWRELGIMFTIMLLPFVIFELPLGKIADKKIGEKEILALGFIIMIFSVFAVSLVTTATFLIWAIILFMTRVGASFAEITTESYFFKHVNSSNADFISFFRITRPLSYIIAPAVATISLVILNYYHILLN
jgi:MFS family permease